MLAKTKQIPCTKVRYLAIKFLIVRCQRLRGMMLLLSSAHTKIYRIRCECILEEARLPIDTIVFASERSRVVGSGHTIRMICCH